MMMYEASNPGSKEMFCIRKVEEGRPLLVHESENVYYRIAALDGGIQRVLNHPPSFSLLLQQARPLLKSLLLHDWVFEKIRMFSKNIRPN